MIEQYDQKIEETVLKPGYLLFRSMERYSPYGVNQEILSLDLYFPIHSQGAGSVLDKIIPAGLIISYQLGCQRTPRNLSQQCNKD